MKLSNGRADVCHGDLMCLRQSQLGRDTLDDMPSLLVRAAGGFIWMPVVGANAAR
jgi:hypothetical protein